MEERQKRYSMTLADGTLLTRLHLNGNNYISRDEVTEATFAGKLDTVIINDDDGESMTLHDAELVQITQENDEWWFILREMSEEEKRQRDIEITLLDLQAQADYIAMMTDVEM